MKDSLYKTIERQVDDPNSRSRRLIVGFRSSRVNRTRRWLNKPALGRQTSFGRFIRPWWGKSSRQEAIVIGLFIVAALAAVWYHQQHPSNRTSASPSHSVSASPPSSTSAVNGPQPVPSISTQPPSGFPTAAAAGVPAPKLLQSLQTFMGVYYTQNASDTLASYTQRLLAVTPPAVYKTLDLSLEPVGSIVTPTFDLANTTSQKVANGDSYVTAPLFYTVTAPKHVAVTYQQTTYSEWQPHADGSWTLVLFKTNNAAHGN